MKINKLVTGILLFILIAIFINAAAYAGSFNARCTEGIIIVETNEPSAEGNLVQLIWAGPDGIIDPPDPSENPGSMGMPTGDDVFIRSTAIGNGYLEGLADGRFDKLFTHSQIQPNRMVYLRAWDAPEITGQMNRYGNSVLYEIQNANENESYDYPGFGIDSYLVMAEEPVELTSFNVNSVAGRVVFEWTTQSESENLGFHIYKSESVTGPKIRVNEQMIKGALNSETRHDYQWEERVTEGGQIVYYWVADVATDGKMVFHGPIKVETIAAPKFYALDQNYPNPFNPSTTITYKLKDDSKVKLNIFNVRGQLVRELVEDDKIAGEYSIQWDGLDNSGLKVPSGLYFYSIQANNFKATKKMAFTK